MERTLVLNAGYEPLSVTSWKKAVCLHFCGKAEVLAEYDRMISSFSFSMKLPSVVRLHRHIHPSHTYRSIKFTRANVYWRDQYTCQYCGVRFPSEHLTFDHVIPVALLGEKSWENIVTCCFPCNRRKGGLTPQQAGMVLRRKPKRPKGLEAIHWMRSFHPLPEPWKDYLHYTCEHE